MKNSVISVAMSGSIIPTPLATPTTRADEPATSAVATLCTVSVVMIARATASASSTVKGVAIPAIPARTRSIG